MPSSNKDFKALQKRWYDKLKKSGFVDIEGRYGRLDIDKALNNIVTHYDQNTFAAKQDYYRLAGQFLNDYEFKSKMDRYIWEQHAEGVSIRNITKKLQLKGYNAYKRKTHERLQFLVGEMRSYVCSKK